MKPFKNWSAAKTWAYKNADGSFCFLSWYQGAVIKMRMEPLSLRLVSGACMRTGIPGLSWSWRRAVGISVLKGKISRRIGVPLTKSGRERKVGRIVFSLLGRLFR